jgi:rubrerythrin
MTRIRGKGQHPPVEGHIHPLPPRAGTPGKFTCRECGYHWPGAFTGPGIPVRCPMCKSTKIGGLRA